VVAGVPVVWLSRPVMDVESEVSGSPVSGSRLPWPYFMRLPFFGLFELYATKECIS
jgi:hypothetical protein